MARPHGQIRQSQMITTFGAKDLRKIRVACRSDQKPVVGRVAVCVTACLITILAEPGSLTAATPKGICASFEQQDQRPRLAALASNIDLREIATGAFFVEEKVPAARVALPVNESIPIDIADVPVDAGLNEADGYNGIHFAIWSLILIASNQLLSMYQRTCTLALRTAKRHLCGEPLGKLVRRDSTRRSARLGIVGGRLVQLEILEPKYRFDLGYKSRFLDLAAAIIATPLP